MKQLIYFRLFVLMTIFCCTQTKVQAQQTRYYDVANGSHGDCISAIQISVADTIHAIQSPKGYGNNLEFSNNDPKSLLYIQREHHTVWYQFELPFDGELAFELTPYSPKDDYDFMLFRYNDSTNFCQQVAAKNIQPIRTNISRNNKAIQSKTGLMMNANQAKTVRSGPGEDYSRSIQVKQGERYFLLVDNVYKNGDGHQIIFNYQYKIDDPNVKTFTLEGVVSDEATNTPIEADVNLRNKNTGKTIASTKSDAKTGEYSITFSVPKSELPKQEFNLEIYKDGYFFDSQDIQPSQLPDLSNIKPQTQLPKIEKGKLFQLSNINFYGNQAKVLPRSYMVLQTLLKVMQDNPTLKIRIEGHTNGCGNGRTFSEKLSKARAETIRDYLADNDVDENRIEFEGFACDRMLYPQPKTQTEQMLNRRVEFRVLDY